MQNGKTPFSCRVAVYSVAVVVLSLGLSRQWVKWNECIPEHYSKVQSALLIFVRRIHMHIGPMQEAVGHIAGSQ